METKQSYLSFFSYPSQLIIAPRIHTYYWQFKPQKSNKVQRSGFGQAELLSSTKQTKSHTSTSHPHYWLLLNSILRKAEVLWDSHHPKCLQLFQEKEKGNISRLENMWLLQTEIPTSQGGTCSSLNACMQIPLRLKGSSGQWREQLT